MPSYLPNLISIFRGSLSLLFFQEKTFLRLVAIVLAMISDVLDGFLARRFSKVSFLGAVIDPVMDRIFVFAAAFVLYFENSMSGMMILLMLSRDLAVFSFALYLIFSGKWKDYVPSSLLMGKATTALQFLLILMICLGFQVPVSYFFIFLFLGMGAFVELFVRSEPKLS